MKERTIGVGILGLGFMGRTHAEAYADAARAGFANRLVAVCDRDAARRGAVSPPRGNLAVGADPLDLSEAALHDDAERLFADPDVELVSICTHTDTHVELTLRALAANKHVLVEKPLTLAPDEAARVVAAARQARTLCMPAMCIRFWPAWRWLRERIVEGTFGAVRSAVFRRLASHPDWSADFYADPEKSGGALFDLHVHDADFVQWCFGRPHAVTTRGSAQHLATLYDFPDGPDLVLAEGGWDHTRGFPFHMGYTVVFEEATADYAFGRVPELRLARDGVVDDIVCAEGNGYEHEVRHVLAAVAGDVALDVTAADAEAVTRLLAAERASLERGATVAF